MTKKQVGPRNAAVAAQISWWENVAVELAQTPDVEMELREHGILEAFMLAIISPPAQAIVRQALQLPENMDEEKKSWEVARRMIGWSYMLGRGILEDAPEPPLGAVEMAALLSKYSWERVPTPPVFDRELKQ